MAALRFGLDARPGLRARFYTSSDWTGAPARAFVDDTVGRDSLLRGWDFLPPDTFTARWNGYLLVDTAGVYTFSATSDDGSSLAIDGRVVAGGAATRGLTTQSGTVQLAPGSHAVVIEYVQLGDAFEMQWSWAAEGAPLSPLPGWRLSSRPRGYATLVLVRVLGWLWRLCWLAAACAAIGLAAARRWWPARDETAPQAVTARRPAALCLALFAAAAILQTWPLAAAPGRLSRNDAPDTMLNEWAMAWVAHQLPRAPLHLFDANIFYPEPHALALSEPLIVQGVLAAPFLWSGASPTLAYNLVLIAGFTLTGWAMCVVVARWTDDWIAGVASGLMFAFNAHTLTRLPHIQAQHAEFLPLALLALDMLLRRPRWRAACLLGASVAAQAFASLYLLIFTAIAVGIGTLVRPEDWAPPERLRRVAVGAALAGLVAAVALTPLLWPYWQLKAAGITRGLDEAQFFAASWRDYVTTQNRWHPTYLGGSALFPGVMPVLLASVALFSGAVVRDARARMCLAFGIVGVVLSFGPAVAPGYAFFFQTVPLLQAIRTSSRFGYLGLAAIAVLGGYGLRLVRGRVHGRARTAVSAALLTLVFLDPLAAPLSLTPFERIPAIYQMPAADPDAIVAEMPLAPPDKQFRDGAADLRSTANWRPLINGYSGFTPPGYVRRFLAMNAFPAASSIAALQRAGVTHVFVHTDQFDERALSEIRGTAALHEIAAEGPVVLYTLDRSPDYR